MAVVPLAVGVSIGVAVLVPIGLPVGVPEALSLVSAVAVSDPWLV